MEIEITDKEIYWLEDLLQGQIHEGTDHYVEEHEEEDYARTKMGN